MLNLSKGPAVHSLRVQADKHRYSQEMKKTLEKEDNLELKMTEVVKITHEDNNVTGVITKNGAYYESKTVVITTGTYLKSSIIIGENQFNEGPSGLLPANYLSDSLSELGIELRRFKTGTPARVHRRSVDTSKMTEQPGDLKIVPFSFMNRELDRVQVSCYLTYTNEKTHEIIRKNIHRSPLYNGTLKSTGPRYCPSIEDKVMRFPDKERHQIFIEPEGENTDELYVQGMSSSLPEDVQIEMLRSIDGLENAEIMRIGYAIEYDCINPKQLDLSLEIKHVDGLFSAGQFNGSSGYEEAASQGIIAGINAALKVQGKKPIILKRSDGYMGVLIDDLVTKGTNEPYRMMTSRAEYRLLLRQDNADLRLTQIGYDIGLVSEERLNIFTYRKLAIDDEINRIKEVKITNKREVNEWLKSTNSAELKKPISLYELIKRPELNYEMVAELDKDRVDLPLDVQQQVSISAKYEGYIQKQLEQVKQFKKFENKKIPTTIDYKDVKSLRIEAMQKLNEIKPENLGQASRISGVSPADITVLMIYLEQNKDK